MRLNVAIRKSVGRNYILSLSFFFFFCYFHAVGDAATKGQWKEWKTMPLSEQNGTKWLLSAILCKGHQKSLTVEQKSRQQRHAPTCKHKSPSLSLDLWFPASVLRSAAEPFPANFSHENMIILIFLCICSIFPFNLSNYIHSAPVLLVSIKGNLQMLSFLHRVIKALCHVRVYVCSMCGQFVRIDT